MPALLMMMSIWNPPDEDEGLEKCSRAAAMRAGGPVGVPTSAWTGTARMLWVEESWEAKVEASSEEEEEV